METEEKKVLSLEEKLPGFLVERTLATAKLYGMLGLLGGSSLGEEPNIALLRTFVDTERLGANLISEFRRIAEVDEETSKKLYRKSLVMGDEKLSELFKEFLAKPTKEILEKIALGRTASAAMEDKYWEGLLADPETPVNKKDRASELRPLIAAKLGAELIIFTERIMPKQNQF